MQAARTLPTVVYMAGPRLLVLLFLLVQPAVLAGVQVGLCYCNAGVCYKSAGELCLSDEDFYGEGGELGFHPPTTTAPSPTPTPTPNSATTTPSAP